MAAEPAVTPPFTPYVPEEARLPELSVRAVALGSLLGLIFGASSVYLALRVGLTVSASVPIAVLSITIFRALSHRLGGRASILENTVVQTTGSAGESIAAGAAFTLPALVLLGFEMDWTRTLLLSLCGGVLGVLMMIPLRRYLIVKEHGVLTYPEGTACAEVLIAGEERGAQAKLVFSGLFAGLGYKALGFLARLWPTTAELPIPRYRAAQVSVDMSPELMGVGYIIGYRSSAIMVGGGLLSWLVLIPAIALFGQGRAGALYPGTVPIDQMSPADIWNRYIRYIGAGAVAAGGIINLIKAMPTIVDSFRASFRDLKLTTGGGAEQRRRTERDIPISIVLIGSIALAVFMSFLPQLKAVPGIGVSILSAVAIIVFGFFFSVVSSRITGELGSSSNPVSGMAIATLMGVCLTFVILGWTGHAFTAAALSIGTVVCIAASNAGTTSQDLKTSFLVGGTPWKQQVALIVGVVTSVVVIGGTLQLINKANQRVQEAAYTVTVVPPPTAPVMTGPDGARYREVRVGGVEGIPDGRYLVTDDGHVRYRVQEGVGSESAPAPQATLMSLVIKGILSRQLPWGLVLLGVFTSILMEIIGVPALAFAVGVYLPLESTTPIFIGGLVRKLVDWKRGSESESDAGPGVLYSSGLVAGGSIMGLLTSFLGWPDPRVERVADALGALGQKFQAAIGSGTAAVIGFALFLGVAWLIHRAATRQPPVPTKPVVLR
ncbi:MAG: oligopeptide transporter, OPT family [Acidobacteria bacterium]|nr:MAG: oligopeptide transporter, OPT family [Acidobacteriota bacterium]